MKKTTSYIYIIVILMASLLSGCKHYLDLPPKNQRALETLDDIKATAAGYLYAYAKRGYSFLPVAGPNPAYSPAALMFFQAYADDVDFQKSIGNYVNPANTSAAELFYANELLWNDYTVPTDIWNTYYSAVGFANTMIQQLDGLTDGDPVLRDQIRGEMLTHRAYYIFKLLEYFAPYHDADMGIPVYLNTGGKVYGVANPRLKQQDVYTIVIKDLKDALVLLAKTPPKSGFNIWYNANDINNILAQVYWFKAESGAKEASDYTDAKMYASASLINADAYIPNTTALVNQIQQGTVPGYPAYGNNGPYSGVISAIFGSPYAYLGNYYPKDISVSTGLVPLYSSNDIRAAAYLTSTYVNANWPDGKAGGQKNGVFLMFQPEEAYLILAEAEYRLHDEPGSRTVLNKFKAFMNAGTVGDGVSGDQLLTEIKNERRRQFFLQRDMRWLDLKRYGGVTINRQLNFFGKPYNVTVAPDDFHYALPIPLDELQQNPSLTANPGWIQINF